MSEAAKEQQDQVMKKYENREISWLSFNNRVLDEADDPSVPLIERIKFLGIFSSNLDEFFRVRVATLDRLVQLGKGARKLIGHDPAEVLKTIQTITLKLNLRFDQVYARIREELAKENIFIIDEQQLSSSQAKFVDAYFLRAVRPHLLPVILDQVKKFPDLKDQSIYLLVCMKKKPESQKISRALIEVPTDVLSRFILLPSVRAAGDPARRKLERYIILLDDVIRFGLKHIFSVFGYGVLDAYTIKLTRDAELDIDEDFSESYVKKVGNSLKQRKEGQLVRFIFDSQMPENVLKGLLPELGIDNNDALIPGAKYHSFKDFIKFPDLGIKRFRYHPLPFLPHRDIEPAVNLFKQMTKRDILLHYPYQSFFPVLDFLREASIDPKVRSIKITLYRVARHSAVVNALINAVRNGKKVTVVMELQARFDEAANIFWSNRLQEEGVRVICGVQGLKVHAKLCLVTRRLKDKDQHFAIVGTGNFNEDTTGMYSDHSLFTADRRITKEVWKVFEFFDNNYKVLNFNHLIVSPFQTRKKLIKLIGREIKLAQDGKKASIHLKFNNLDDEDMIDHLYKAGRAGVEVRLIIRSMFSLIPGVPGLSDNIEAISIVDRFLEHSRFFIFGNGGDELVYLTSADLMRRNLDRRVEVTVPVYDPKIKEEVRQFFDIQWADNVKARIRCDGLVQPPRTHLIGKRVRSQDAIYSYLKALSVKESEAE